MKRLAIASACLFLSIGIFAQQTVVKEAERAMKGKESFAKVVKIVTPAFTNPETQNEAQTYYVPGKAAFNEYDNLLGLKAFNKLPEDGNVTMGKDLLEGYDYMKKALSLDSVTDQKGKIKTKYSKDIINTLVGHYNDYNNHAIELWNLSDYKGAYRAWEIYDEMSENPGLYKGIKVPHDSLMCEIIYNQALAAWQSDDYQASLKCFLKSIAKGYDKKIVYDYAISVASNIPDSTALLNLCYEAIPKYGKEDPTYIRLIINDFLQKKQYDEALNYIDQAISTDPNNADYYMVKGVIYDNKGNRDQAKLSYKKAIELDGKLAQPNFFYGKSLCEDAYELSDKAPSDPDQIEAYYNSTIKPVFEEAAKYLEKAYELDPEDSADTLRYLENVYYNLKNEDMLNDVERRKAL